MLGEFYSYMLLLFLIINIEWMQFHAGEIFITLLK